MAVLLGLAASCASDQTVPPQAIEEATDTPGAATPPSLSDLAARIDCTPETRQEPFAREAGGCEFAGGTLRLITFSSAQGQQNWLEAAQGVGVGVLVIGELWVANTSGQAVAEAVQAAVGGEIR